MPDFLRLKKNTILLFDLFITAIIFAGIIQVINKGDLPTNLKDPGGAVLIYDTLKAGSNIDGVDKVFSINGISGLSRDRIEIILDRYMVGDEVELIISRNNSLIVKKEILVPFYSNLYILSILIVGLLFLIIAFIVLYKSRDERIAQLFHHSSVLVALIITTTWGSYNSLPYNLGYFVRLVFNFGYILAPAAFLHFILLFPKDRTAAYGKAIILIYVTALFIGILKSVFFLNQAFTLRADSIQLYEMSHNYSRYITILFVLISILIFAGSFKNAETSTEKKKLKWLLSGFIVGPGSYIALWIIPQSLGAKGFAPEEIIVFAMLAVPVSFAIAIIKYRLLDIDLLINRSLVYSIAISGLTIVYLVFIGLISSLFNTNQNNIVSIFAAVIVALAFQPAKNRIQKFVDKKFFKVSYDFRIALIQMMEEIKGCNDIKSLADKIVYQINKFIPVESAGFFLAGGSNRNPDLLCGTGIETKVLDEFEISEFNGADKYGLVPLSDCIESAVQIKSKKLKSFNESKAALAIPVYSSKKELYAFILLGKKKSGQRFTVEDLDLLNQIAIETGLTIDMLTVQEKLMREQFEREKLDELNKLKSLLVSNVSHDLKTPLTSIKMFAELLEDSSPTSKEYSGIIIGESDRLTRLIDNVLDYAKIEKGIKEYFLKPADLSEVVRKTLVVMKYPIEINKAELNVRVPSEPVFVSIDPDAVEQALINLISNALKYTGETKKIDISLVIENNYSVISVADNGFGIQSEMKSKVFDPFSRLNSDKTRQIKGSGLGLAIVKQIMESHKGRVELFSVPGYGSTFKLYFPINNNHEQRI